MELYKAVCVKFQSLLYLVGVRPVLVFGPVRGVGEGFVASFVLADVRFLASVRTQMSFKILQTRVSLRAALELQRSRKEKVSFCSRKSR